MAGARAIANFFVHHHIVMVHEEDNSCSRRGRRFLSSPVWAYHLHVHGYHLLHVGLHLYRNNVVHIFFFLFLFSRIMFAIQPFMQ